MIVSVYLIISLGRFDRFGRSDRFDVFLIVLINLFDRFDDFCSFLAQGRESEQLFPYGIYTIPEVSMIGKTEAQLTAEGVSYEVN